MWDRIYFTTGVLTRNLLTNFIRITCANLGNKSAFVNYQIYDWSNGTPIILKTDIVVLGPIEVKFSDIKISTSIYGDSLNAKLYEIRLDIIGKKDTIVNIFGISDTGIINDGNTVLYKKLVPITREDYNFD